MTPYRFARGTRPLLISMPHVGTHIPAEIASRMTDAGRAVADTDWHVDKLYHFARDLGANMVFATHSRYVADLNRSPDGAPLYPGASNTELVPLHTFAGEPIYQSGAEPDAAEVTARRETYWRPYHELLRGVLDRLVAEHGRAVLFDAHSIAARVPRFFDGALPDLNIGTGGGTSCAPALADRAVAVAAGAEGYSHVLDGRFKGGYITRAYGRPESGVHALQLELSWATYLTDGAPYALVPDAAEAVTARALRPLIEAVLAWVEGG